MKNIKSLGSLLISISYAHYEELALLHECKILLEISAWIVLNFAKTFMMTAQILMKVHILVCS